MATTVESTVKTMPAFTEATLDAKVPDGPLTEKWEKHRFEMKLVNPANKRKFNVIVVGSGLGGASAAATMAETGL